MERRTILGALLRASFCFLTMLWLANYVFSAQVSVSGTQNSKLEDSTLYFVNTPYLLIQYQTDSDEVLKVFINNELKAQLSGSGNKTLSTPISRFNLRIDSNKTGTIYNQNITPVKLSIQDLIISLTTPQPTEYEPVNFKVTIVNDGSPDEDLLLKIIIYDENNNKIKELSYSLYLDSDSSITKYGSFTPSGSGVYYIKAYAYEKDLLLKESEKEVRVQIAKPEIILSLSKTETVLPDDILAQVQIKNSAVQRDYTVKLLVYSPDGDLIFQEKKTVSVSENSIRNIIFTVHLSEEYPPGPYLFISRVEFTVSNKTYSIDTQKTLTAITSAPSISFSLKTPDQIENDKNFVYLLDIKHQSTREYDYYYQCFVYDPDGVLVKQDPPSPNLVSLQPKEITTIKQQFTIPSNWREGIYTIVCRIWRGDTVWEDSKNFRVIQPEEYVNLIVMSTIKEGKIVSQVCYSTKALQTIQAKLTIYFKSTEGILYVDGPHNIKLKNQIECIESKYQPPEFTDPRDVRIQAVLSYSGMEISKESNSTTKRGNVIIQCDKKVVTPQDLSLTCSIITPEKGNIIVGIVPEGVDVPLLFESARSILRNYVEQEIDRTASVTLSVPKDLQNAKVVVLFKDPEGFIYKSEYPIEIIPVLASIRSVTTFSDKYYKNDEDKPLIERNKIFYQDVTVCSKSKVPIEVKIIAEPPSDLIAVGLSNSETIELSPKQCVTKTFIFKASKYLPPAPLKISYYLYYVKGEEEYLIGTKVVQGPAPEIYYKLQEEKEKKKIDKSKILIILIALMIIFLALYVYFSRKKKIEEVTQPATLQTQETPK